MQIGAALREARETIAEWRFKGNFTQQAKKAVDDALRFERVEEGPESHGQ